MNRLIIGVAFSLASLASHAQDFKLSSNVIKHGEQIDNAYVQNGSGCSGTDISPALSWSGAPEGTKSFAVTMFDPDAPTGSGWWHWTVVNIPKEIHDLPADAGNRNGSKVPPGAVQGRTDFGSPGYGGPCPPLGDKSHHYHFKVWALKVQRLPVDSGSSGALVGYLLNVNSIATSELVPISTR
ncbi:Raf kinase inhibitor-like YbhB/YbcL family protein [Burkholderia sp. OAS925]|uniref:kinase inhibitor n=1 Tax=Paraburkholderia TaxID=1822464 RepID=UPI0017899007|nr:kinase inhibitor [Paraburkholderia graminis]MDR6475792.1 Raf kinase inhibitor-like YbhB/YbcL family protein [Paraburkholderia graminis]